MLSFAREKYLWTEHSRNKMKFYGLSESRIKRIIRFPKRTEEGIVPHTVAVMQPAGSKKYQEIWTMYKITNLKPKTQSSKLNNFFDQSKKIKIITAWRYPGKSPERDPVPAEIIEEVRKLL